MLKIVLCTFFGLFIGSMVASCTPNSEPQTSQEYTEADSPTFADGGRHPASEATRKRSSRKRRSRRKKCRGRKCRRRGRGKRSSIIARLKKTFSITKGGGCTKGMTMKYQSKKGSKNACHFIMSKNLRKAVTNDFKSCVHTAAKTEGWPPIFHIEVTHMGIFNPRKARGSSKWSTHASARAFDLSQMTLQFAPQQTDRPNEVINFTKNTKYPRFYNRLRKCWSKKNKCNKSKGYKGSRIDNLPKAQNQNDKRRRYRKAYRKVVGLHDDHLHMSYGCPSMKGHRHIYRFKPTKERYSLYSPK